MIPRLVAIWEARVGRRTRSVVLAAFLAAVMLAAHIARLGTLEARGAAASLLVVVLVAAVVVRIRARRALSTPEGVIRRVVVRTDRALGERALRAQALAVQTAADPSLGSPDLAQLHLERVLGSISLDAVTRTARTLGARAAIAGSVLLAIACAAVLVAPMRIVEGLDVLAARRGVAPLPLSWLSLVRISAQPPLYLRASEQRLFPALGSALPRGSVVTVRGVPERLGRSLVLTDGVREVAFVDDGSGNVVAHWTLKEDATLRVAARFGDVIIPERDSLELEAVPDDAPRIQLEEAPRTVKLKELDRLELRFLAQDDHGLRQIDLVLRSGAREERRVLLRLDGQSKLERGAHSLDPRDAFLRRMFLPVVATIEARDNDASNVAKWGRSEAVTILPPTVGEPEALRLAALESARDRLVDLLDHQLSTERTKRRLTLEEQRERKKQEKELVENARAGLRGVLAGSYAGVRVSGGLSAFVSGQARALEKRGGDARRRTEDVLLASDAGIRALATRDAQQVSKRLGDVAEEAAEGAKVARNGEQRKVGLGRLSAALMALDRGAENLVTLGGLGADLGSVAQGEIRRVRRAERQGHFIEAELAARHLAGRLRRPNPSFSSAGGGGVEAGQGSPGPGEASEADQQFDQLMRELEQLASEHSEEIRRVERTLSDAEQAEDANELKREASERAGALREKLSELPQAGSQPGSARAAAALGREHMSAMAQNLERLAFKDAVESGQSSDSMLKEAERLAKDRSRAANWMDEKALSEANRELRQQLAWAQQVLESMKQKAAGRAAEDLASAAQRETALSRRAGNLAGRGAHSEAKLPDELSDALERAESAMQQAAGALAEGRGDEGLELQREAQRLLERSSSGRTSDGDESSEPRQGTPEGEGRDGAQSGNVPSADKARRAEEFRRRVLEGLAGKRRGRLGPAVERYAEGLLE